MAKVLTANVLITRDSQSLENLFGRDLLDLNSIDRTKFLISPKNNKYLVSMEYEINFDSDSHTFLVLNFADVDGRFELDYFNTQTNSLHSMLQNAVSNKRSSEVDKIYLSFGCGEYKKDWSNPMSFELYKANVDIKEGMKYFTLYYVPVNLALFQNPIYYNFKEINPKAQHFALIDSNIILNIKVEIENDDSYEMILYKLYKVYLEKICSTKNIILLIPDGLQAKLKEIADKQTGDIKRSLDEVFQDTFKVRLQYPLKYIYDIERAGGNSVGSCTEDVMFEQDDYEKRKSQKQTVSFSSGKLDSSLNNIVSPLPFDVYTPINSLSKGLQTCMNADVGELKVIAENDIRMQSIFRKFGLIKAQEDRSVVAGLEFQVNDYIYRSLAEGADFSKPLMDNKDYGELPRRGAYDEALKSIFRIKNNSSAFSEKILLDELSVKGSGVNKATDSVVKDLLKKSSLFEEDNIPIFVNNLKNSNVISIDIDNTANPYFIALNIAKQTESYNELVKAAQKEIDIQKHKSEGDEVESLIDEVVRSLEAGSDLSKLSVNDVEEILFARLLLKEDYARLQRLGKDFTVASEKQRKKNNLQEIKILAATIYKFLQDKDTLILMQDSYGSQSSDFRRAALFRTMYKIGSIQVKLKTLPYFNMSSIKNISNQLSLLISKKIIGQISPVNNALKNPEDYLDYFSGTYNIVGFRHVISGEEMYSQFKLIKKTMETL